MPHNPDPPDFEPIEANRGVPIPLAEAATWIGSNPERVASAVQRYFYPHAVQSKIFQGQHFEWFVDRSDPSRFTAGDLAAVGALSVSVRPQSARTLIEDRDNTYASLLAKCHTAIAHAAATEPDLDLSNCPVDWIESADSPFAHLYGEVRRLPGVGYVTCSKLISAKFPALIPIRDGRVEKLLELQKDRHWWNPMRKLLQSGRVRALLSEITLPEGAPKVTVLRRLDVALWMEARSREIGNRARQ